MEVFKGFHSQAHKICTDFLINIFTENGHSRNTLTNITTEYLRNINKQKTKTSTIRTTPRTLSTSKTYHGC